MTRLPITFACDTYDRTMALYDGRVQPEGVSLNYLVQGPVETLWRQLQYAEFDASEMSLSAYMLETSRDESRFIGLPVFLVRMFRRANVYVRADAGIELPQDLLGKRVGVPEYHMTAALFIRGFLADDYGVEAEDLEWYQGGQEVPGRRERVELDLPDNIRIQHVADRTIDEMLVSGDLDAVITGAPIASHLSGDPRVRSLFPNSRELDIEAYRRTSIFPIMHLLVLRKDVYDANPWVAQNLYRAFDRAKNVAADYLNSWRGCGAVMLPFFQETLDAVVQDFGRDFWPYGIEPNRPTLEAAVRYSYEQGLSRRRLTVEELFAPNLVESRA